MKKHAIMKKVALVLTGLLIAGSLAGCTTPKEITNPTTKDEESNPSELDTDQTGKESIESGKVITLKIGASPTPHAEILEAAKPLLKEKGIDLEIIEFTDYVQPNLVVDAGDLDANYFQHLPYLEFFNEEQKTDLVSAAAIHYEPLGIYPGKSKDLKNIPDGANIAVPNDTTNEARALLLLEANGIIKLKEGAGIDATVRDIEENPFNVKIVELEAAQISRVVGEMDFAVLNGNYALQANFNVETDSLARELKESEAAVVYGNIIAVRAGDEKREEIKTLVEILNSEEIKQFIIEKYEGSVVSLN